MEGKSREGMANSDWKKGGGGRRGGKRGWREDKGGDGRVG